MFKKMICLVSLVLVLGLINDASAELVAHWTFDEGSGTTAVDATGNGHDGTLFGNPQWTDGYFGGCLKFDGSRDKVDVPYSAELNPENEFTVTLWASVDKAVTDHQSPLTSRDSGAKGYIIYCNDENNWEFRVGQGRTGWPAVAFKEWTHVAATYSNGEMKLYINGELVGEGSSTINPNTEQVLRIGAGATEGDGSMFFEGMIDDVRIYNHALSAGEVSESMRELVQGLASPLFPYDGATDVPREVILSWEPGVFAAPTNGHIVYFSESFNDVNDGIGGITQDASSYTPLQRLEFGKTYYWRIDEVSAPPDTTIIKGNVWSFKTETEGVLLTSDLITATASSVDSDQIDPNATINRAGLDDQNLHNDEKSDMWLCSVDDPEPWIRYDFDQAYKLHNMKVWNHNSDDELVMGYGTQQAKIETSVDGEAWTELDSLQTFNQASGAMDYAANTTVSLGGVIAQSVRITALSNWSPLPQLITQKGLSEVQFSYIPVWARTPDPDTGATDVDVDVTLGWRAGREAAMHDVYLSTDEQAVIDGTAPVEIMTETSYSASLDLDSTYYWRVDEVNEAETTTIWQGEIWSLSTPEYLVVDDFESYNDLNPDDPESNRIFLTWIGGDDEPANGSQVGHDNYPFAEQTTVYTGNQSLPLFYDNTSTDYSEATVNVADLQVVQDWTKHGIKALKLQFSGDPSNDLQKLYVKINGTTIPYDGDVENLTRARANWQMWYIDLASHGVSLSNVTELAIGLERIGALGGRGVVFLDDIRLYSDDRPFTPVEPSTAGLVGHWTFDEGSGTTAVDATGNGHDGTLFGNPQWTDGKVGGALWFAGAPDKVEVPYSAELNPEEFTLTMWLNPAPARGEYRDHMSPVTSRDSGPSRGYMIYIAESGEEWFEFRIGDGGWRNLKGPMAAYRAWTHLAATYSNGEMKLYINGELVGELSATISLNTEQGFRIGAGGTGGDGQMFYEGLIDDIRVYNRPLTEAEIAGLAGRPD